jgi:hypothetical protein
VAVDADGAHRNAAAPKPRGLAIEEACASGIPSKEAMFEAVKAEALIP